MSTFHEAMALVANVPGKIIVLGDVSSATSMPYADALRAVQVRKIPLVHLQTSSRKLVEHPLVTYVVAPSGPGFSAWYDRVAEAARGCARIVVVLDCEASAASLRRTLAEGGVAYYAKTGAVVARKDLADDGEACLKPS